MKPLVLYHADCTDGYGAAFAAWTVLGDSAEYMPVKYGDGEWANHPREFFAGREIYILDFSFPRYVMDALFEVAQRVVWLDHHKTAFEMWDAVAWMEQPNGLHQRFGPGGVECHIQLNNNKSGALLAWEYFHPGAPVPLIIRHIDDRDRWQWELDGSAEIHAALASVKPWSFEQWKTLFKQVETPKWAQMFEAEGSAILRAQKQQVESMAKQARKCRIWCETNVSVVDAPFANSLPGPCELPGLAVNASLHMSELGHELANQSGTFGLVWYVGADNKVKLSFRSNGDYDVSVIAKALGGGGHKNAAGAETDIGTLMEWLR